MSFFFVTLKKNTINKLKYNKLQCDNLVTFCHNLLQMSQMSHCCHTLCHVVFICISIYYMLKI